MTCLAALLALVPSILPQDQRLSPIGSVVDQFRVSPDGSTVVFTTRATPPEVYSVSLRNLELVRRTPPGFGGPIDELSLAPRSNAALLKSFAPSALHSLPLKSPGLARRLDTLPGLTGRSLFGPGSARVYTLFQPTGATRFELYGTRADGALPPVLLSDPATGVGRIEEFLVAPNGRTVVYVERQSGGVSLKRVVAVPATGGTPVVLGEATSRFPTRLVAFTTDSNRLRFLQNERLYEVPTDGSSAPVPLLDLPLRGDYVFLAPDGRGLIVDGPYALLRFPLYFIDLVGSAPPVLLDAEVDCPFDLCWSPDSSWVVFVNDQDAAAPWSHFELRSAALDGTFPAVPLLTSTAIDSPISDLVFETSATRANVLWLFAEGIWTRSQYGIGSARKLSPPTADVVRFVRTPDDQLVYSTPDRLYLLPEIDIVTPRLISSLDDDAFELTPEGRRVLYVRAGELYLHYLTPPHLPR